MSNRLVALAATLGIASLAAASLVGATVPSVNGPSFGGGMHGGGGGGAGGAHGGGGGYAGHIGGGNTSGSRFGGGHASAAARFRGGGYRGGAYAGHTRYAAHASFMAHGGYVAHGRSGYRIVGYESAGPARFGAMPRAAQGARIALALGPRLGSAAAATRMNGTEHGNHLRPRAGHPYCPPRHPKHPHVRVVHPAQAYVVESPPPMFCQDFTFLPPGKRPYSGCLTPLKAKVLKAR